jgi:hypothetical protein
MGFANYYLARQKDSHFEALMSKTREEAKAATEAANLATTRNEEVSELEFGNRQIRIIVLSGHPMARKVHTIQSS